jgi:hypothetical protein
MESAHAKGYDLQNLLNRLERNRRQHAAFHLPEVCRQIYSETAILAYKSNAFQIGFLHGPWIERLLPAQRDVITSVQPTTLVAEAYSGSAMSQAREFLREPLRSRFPNLARIEITHEAEKEIIFRNACRMDPKGERSPQEMQEQIAQIVKKKEGEDVEVFFQD